MPKSQTVHNRGAGEDTQSSQTSQAQSGVQHCDTFEGNVRFSNFGSCYNFNQLFTYPCALYPVRRHWHQNECAVKFKLSASFLLHDDDLHTSFFGHLLNLLATFVTLCQGWQIERL